MGNNVKTIAVLTSGGDAPGMNAAVRGVYSRAKELGYRVLGIRDGYAGLLKDTEETIFELQFKDVEDIIPFGGTILGTARCLEFKELEVQQKAAGICRRHGIDAVVVIGGDGSFQGALRLHEQGIGVIGIPGTIDLDIGCTEYTLGFDSAVNSAMRMIDQIADTSKAHHCYSVVEVMGRHAGYIAMNCGIANSARKILIPEEEGARERLIEDLREDVKRPDCHYGTIVVAEGAAKAEEIAKEIEEKLKDIKPDIHARANVLGFLQRGGSPTCKDRVYGCEMGAFAVDLIEEEKTCHVVAVKNDRLAAVEIEEALRETRDFPRDLRMLGKTISMRF